MWEEPTLARFLDRLASFGRLICFDKRGTGVSDPVPLGAIPTWEEWMDDVGTVMDAVGSDCATVFGHGDGGHMALLFAATHPNRTSALVLADAYARRHRAPDYHCGVPPQIAEQFIELILSTWGTGKAVVHGSPDLARNPSFVEWRGRYERLSMSPGQFKSIYPLTYELDFRPVLWRPSKLRLSCSIVPITSTSARTTAVISPTISRVPSSSRCRARIICFMVETLKLFSGRFGSS